MLLERTTYVPKAGQYDAVLATRRRACEVRRALHLPVGTILTTKGGANPVIQWECRFPNEAAHAADTAARAGSPDFEDVRATMSTLIDRFDRQILTSVAQQGSVLRDVMLDGVAIAPKEMTFSAQGVDLKGYLFCPPGDGPFPLMVTNHGSGIHQGSQDWCRPGVAALLMSWGIASFLPHRHGYGNSPGAGWRDEVSAAFGTEDYDRQLVARLDAESDDVVAARAFAAGLPMIDSDHVGVMGSSFGGVVTLLSAAKEPAFRCAVEFAGAAMNWDRTPGLRALMHDAAMRLTQPVFFVQAENDHSIRPTRELGAALEAAGRPVRHRVFPALGLTRDEGHYLYRDGPQIWGPDVREFLEAHL